MIIDPKSALADINMQKGIVKLPTAHPAAEVARNLVRLADAFREEQRTVVLAHIGWAADGADAIKTRCQAPPPASAPSPDFFEYIDELKADRNATC